MPQEKPWPAHVCAVHIPGPQTFALVPPQTSVPVQVPQSSVLPHPSGVLPQLKPSDMHAAGVQGGAPHTFMVPVPPQVAGAVHVPQFSTLPQPSAAVPQSRPWSAQLLYAGHMPPPPSPGPESGSMNAPVDPPVLPLLPVPLVDERPPEPLRVPLEDIAPPALVPLEAPEPVALVVELPHEATATTTGTREARR